MDILTFLETVVTGSARGATVSGQTVDTSVFGIGGAVDTSVLYKGS